MHIILHTPLPARARPSPNKAKVRRQSGPQLLPRKRFSIDNIECPPRHFSWLQRSKHMEPPEHIRARIRVQRRPGLFAVRERDFCSFAFPLAVQAEEQRQSLSHVHEVVLRDEADDHVGSDFAVAPGFVGTGAGENVGLGVVEDVVRVGLGNARSRFVERWIERDVGGKFDAVGLWCC